MAPKNRAAVAKAIALRMKAVQMKRAKPKDIEPTTSPLKTFVSKKKSASPNKKDVSQKKRTLSPKNKAGSPKKRTVSPTKKAAFQKKNGASCSSARSVKDVSSSKSGNNFKSTKRAQRAAACNVEDINVTGGLRLLKRRMVTMSHITRRLIRGKRLTVEINDKGEPIGKAAKAMQSYIGVLARTKIPIIIGDWREVDPDEK
ncbi:hypothetical protein RchiOBHm_Chr5g0045841 [Rosa chinensis]|uniref:Uncharacterized protein n=1 Tax=Rosa chinensis TaxID=74649 RepID=A0A2P6QE05_ROSCH|nr:hypothetical protein RchiOBHm_Chr5g0045841 [Rosa chinensis]